MLSSPESALSAKNVPQAPEDPLYGLVNAYLSDKSDKKIDLSVGVYRDDNAKPWVLPAVQKAEQLYQCDPDLDHEYLPIAGLPEFINAAQRLIVGADSPAIRESRICSFQTISGTGAVHLGGALLSRFLPLPTPAIYLSSPTWAIHDQIFNNVGLAIKEYPYFSSKTKMMDFDGMISVLGSAPPGSIILLHACAHNPTGVDPTHDQWGKIAKIIRANRLFPFFDCAYQGFASGSLAQDNFAIRYFIDHGFELAIAQSFSKNMGLYGQRVGAFHYIACPGSGAQEIVERVASQLAILQRSEISTPPLFGAKIASIVLNDKEICADWEKDLRTMSGRINTMRESLKQGLDQLQTPGQWGHITSQIGMFSFTGLSKSQVLSLREKWHVYMVETGRISMAGLNSGNVRYFAEAVDDVVRAAK
ncbi:aspartate aminotransferase [Viridothelium virens]|uniref:Aspartate aminotransferase n=1 Tax=Viridothelium virens TaxID=1048519 RepID=A0A6A6GXC2_VIRVR|nr:aspartate aminotransferase [Viridothelium virens]